MQFAKIAGTGSYLPKKILTNRDLAGLVDTSDEWITERTGIKQRHLIADDETTASMATEAAKLAITAANLNANDIDLILVATCTPDRMFPSTACFVQKALGITNGKPAFDISAACAGFLYGLSIADQFIRAGSAKHVLLIGSEAMSRIVDWNDRNTCVLFGDGAGAVVLSTSDQPGIHTHVLHAKGEFEHYLFLPNDIAAPSIKSDSPYLHMLGQDVFKLAVTELAQCALEAITKAGMRTADIDWIIPHQANARIIQALAKRLKIDMKKVVLTVADHANTSSASIPLALDIAIRDGRIARSQKLLFEAIGGGMTWGSSIVTY